MTTLLPEIDELIKSNEASLVLLGKEISCSSLARAAWTKQDHIQFLLIFQSGRHSDLKLVSEHFSKLRFQLALDSGKIVTKLADLFLGFAGFFELRPVLTVVVLGILLTVLFRAKVLQNSLFHGVILLHSLLRLLDLGFKLLDLTFVIVLLFDLRPKLATWAPQWQEEGISAAAGQEVVDTFQDVFLVNVLAIKVERINFDGLVHRVTDFEFLNRTAIVWQDWAKLDSFWNHLKTVVDALAFHIQNEHLVSVLEAFERQFLGEQLVGVWSEHDIDSLLLAWEQSAMMGPDLETITLVIALAVGWTAD